jgi:type IV pilus assembly protein PilV
MFLIQPPPRHFGFSLIEVLVALIVVAIGLIGVAGIQAAAVKYTKGSEGRSYAAQLAYDITDRISASRAIIQKGAYASLATFQDVPCNRNFSPTTTVQSETDAALWRNQLACSIPGAQGQVIVGPIGSDELYPVTVTIRWDESRLQGGSGQEIYVTRTLL